MCMKSATLHSGWQKYNCKAFLGNIYEHNNNGVFYQKQSMHFLVLIRLKN